MLFLSTLLSFAINSLFSYVTNKVAGGNFANNPYKVLPRLVQDFDNTLHHTKGDIWTFLSKFNGYAKPNRFRVEFTLPKGVKGNVDDVNESSQSGKIQTHESKFNKKGEIDIKCHTVSFPQRALNVFEIKQNSAPFKIPVSSAYDPVTFSFYNDSKLDTRRYFDIWQGAIVNFSNNTLNFYSEYVSDVKMIVEDEQGNDVYGVVLYEAYPLGLSIMDFSYSTSNNLLTTMVTFAFKYWLPMDSTQRVNRSAT